MEVQENLYLKLRTVEKLKQKKKGISIVLSVAKEIDDDDLHLPQIHAFHKLIH